MHERKQLAAKYATDFERIAGEFDRILTQCQKSKHLLIQSSRTAAKAGRLLVKAIDDGVLPQRYANLSGCAKLNTNPQSDGNAMGFFGMFGTVFLRAAYPEKFNANAGTFALSPKPKTDENGKLLGRDGKPVTWVVTGEWGKPDYSARLSDEVATVADDYDELDGLEHLRARTTDYADTCRALAEAFRASGEFRRPVPDSAIADEDAAANSTIPPEELAADSLPFQICEERFSVAMNGSELVFARRGKKQFRLLQRICRRPGFPVWFDTLRENGNVWEGVRVEDSAIKSAVYELKKKLRSANLTILANAIHTETYGNRQFVILIRDELPSN